MKYVVKVKKEIEIKTVTIQVSPRHIGEGDDFDISPSFPGLTNGILTLDIDIDTGVISGWPNGVEQEAFIKVCDAGGYYLKDDGGNIVAQIEEDYVPNGLIPGEYGDYIDLSVDGSGKVARWPARPDLSAFFAGDQD